MSDQSSGNSRFFLAFPLSLPPAQPSAGMKELISLLVLFFLSTTSWQSCCHPEVPSPPRAGSRGAGLAQLPGISHLEGSHVLGMIFSEDEAGDRVKPLRGGHCAPSEPLKSVPRAWGSSIPVAAFQSGRWKGREEESRVYSQAGAVVQNQNPAGLRLSSSAKLSLAVTVN